MKYGKAFYCDRCGSETVTDGVCKQCDPVNGVEELSFFFIMELTPEAAAHLHEQVEKQADERPWWKFW